MLVRCLCRWLDYKGHTRVTEEGTSSYANTIWWGCSHGGRIGCNIQGYLAHKKTPTPLGPP